MNHQKPIIRYLCVLETLMNLARWFRKIFTQSECKSFKTKLSKNKTTLNVIILRQCLTLRFMIVYKLKSHCNLKYFQIHKCQLRQPSREYDPLHVPREVSSTNWEGKIVVVWTLNPKKQTCQWQLAIVKRKKVNFRMLYDNMHVKLYEKSLQ